MSEFGEPWHCGPYGTRDCDGDEIIGIPPTSEQQRRIVTCVNACSGIPSEVLDGFKEGELLDKMTRTAIAFLMDQGYMICREAKDE